jgi:4-amino-4-deoxy-L-arabinose transferase-like glycosyltransferase
VGPVDSLFLDETLENRMIKREYIVVLVAALIYLGCIVSPPALMDDVDAVQAQIARNMLESGDFVTARLNGVAYLEKSPLIYWMMAASYSVFGVSDWSARIPVALSAIALAWLVFRFALWGTGCERTAFRAGLVIATCVGLFLFTRIQIPDVTLTFTIALAMWGFLRALEPDEPSPSKWIYIAYAAVGTGLLLKGLIAALFPVATAGLYLVFTKQLFSRQAWRRIRPLTGTLLALTIAAPWHIAATLANPPYLDFTFRSVPGEYRGFFWFYFMNEHVLRFLNLRHPRDYNTVPRVLFWAFHLLWLFPWSMYFGGLLRQDYKADSRAGRLRLLCLCWVGFILVFFTFSTTQEYYSMPCYPALAILLAPAILKASREARPLLALLTGLALVAVIGILVKVNGIPTPGDISSALTSNPDAYTLSLGHMEDLTIDSFAYLRVPLVLAGLAFAIGLAAALRRSAIGLAAMMVLFLHAARLALVTFDPYLASKALADALPTRGTLIVDNQYYAFSSVFFHTNRKALLLNGRVNNLEYGSYAPGAPQVFIDDQELAQRWRSTSERYYLCIEKPQVDRIRKLGVALHLVKESGGKFLFSNEDSR